MDEVGKKYKLCLFKQFEVCERHSSLGILINYGAFAIGRPTQQCTGRSRVKVDGTYVA